jgi:probable phosphoglycerate mutase
MLLYYIRHGDPIYHPDSLTPRGEEQAEALARRLALFGVDEVYASASNRAILTAKHTCDLLGKQLHILDFLNENVLDDLKLLRADDRVDWVWSHPTYANILTERSVREMGDRWYEHPKLAHLHLDKTILPINEKIDGFLASLGYTHDRDKGLYRITGAHTEKRIAVFAHECMGKIFMSHILDIPFPYYAEHFEMHTSALTVIRFGSSGLAENAPYARAQVLTLSNDAHLYKDGLSLLHWFKGIKERY